MLVCFFGIMDITRIIRGKEKNMKPSILDIFDIGGDVDSGDVEIISWDIPDGFSVSMM